MAATPRVLNFSSGIQVAENNGAVDISVPPTPDTSPTSPSAYDDEFNGDSLAGAWGWEGAGEPSSGGESVIVQDGSLVYELRADTASAAAFKTDAHFLLRDVPAGDWTVTTKIRLNILGLLAYAHTGLWVRGSTLSDGLYMDLTMSGTSNHRVACALITSDVIGSESFTQIVTQNILDVYLRVSYTTAPLFTMSFSLDGLHYIPSFASGTNTRTPGWSPVKFGIYGWSLSTSSNQRVRGSIDWFRVTTP